MKTVIVKRFKVTDNYSLGYCYIKKGSCEEEYVGCTLERGWRDNKSNISCVPEGSYDLKLEYSPRFKKDLWELYGVPNRSECKFHAANYWRQLNGCIALGSEHTDIDGDGDPDVKSSRIVMKEFHKLMSDDKIAKIIIKNDINK